MQLREILVQQPDHVAVPLVFPLVMQATDDMQFSTTVVRRFLATSDDLFVRHHVAFVAAKIRTERAKVATVNADVGRVQVSVNVVVGRVAIFSLAHQVGQLAQVVHRHRRVVHQQAVVHTQTLAGFNFFANGF